MRARLGLARLGIGLVGAAQAEVGLWGELSPHGFFENFPGFGQHWVAMLGVYNDHLVRDYAAAELGFALLLIATAVWFERRLVLVASSAFLMATVPHFIYHLTTTAMMSTTANVLSLGSFVVEIAVVAAVMVATQRSHHDPHATVRAARPRPSAPVRVPLGP